MSTDARRVIRRWLVPTLLLALWFPAAAHAAEDTEAWRGRAWLEIEEEDDHFAQFLRAGTDRNYTQGARAVHMFGVPERPFRWLNWEGLASQRVDLGIVLPAQIMYTPDDISEGTLAGIQGQHPYAGFLYGGLVLRSVSVPDGSTADGSGQKRGWRFSWEMDFGTTGDASLAQEVQTWFHTKVCHCAARPTWVAQIGTQLQLQNVVDVQRALWAVPSPFAVADIGMVALHGELRLGTLFDSLGVGPLLWLGRLGPYQDVSNIASAPRAPWLRSAFLYARSEPRLVLRNGTIQGRLGTSDPYVQDIRRLVWDNELGLLVRLGDVVAFRYSVVFRSSELAVEPWSWKSHLYGVLELLVGRLAR